VLTEKNGLTIKKNLKGEKRNDMHRGKNYQTMHGEGISWYKSQHYMRHRQPGAQRADVQ